MRVVRYVLWVAMTVGAILIAAPFVLSWRAIDERGLEIPGKVESKREYVHVRSSNWQRVCEATISYTPPDNRTSSSLTAKLDPVHYDALRKGRPTTVRYLRREDLPQVPGAAALHDLGVLPIAKLPGQFIFDPYSLRVLGWVACAVIVLVLWHKLRAPKFPWALGVGVAVLLAGVLNSEFPRPTPEPHNNLQTATGRVTSVHRIDYLFSGHRTRGMEADQPIDVVGVEFTPVPGVDPVLAVDLIDAGSFDALQPGATAVVSYEAAAPRTARIHGGTREFVQRNLQAAAYEWALGIALFVGVLVGIRLIGRWLNAAVRRTSSVTRTSSPPR